MCRLDMQIIKEMLNADPVLSSCIANGDEYCTYRVAQPLELVANH
jgi:predicted ArsR family transcriptional regulator